MRFGHVRSARWAGPHPSDQPGLSRAQDQSHRPSDTRGTLDLGSVPLLAGNYGNLTCFIALAGIRDAPADSYRSGNWYSGLAPWRGTSHRAMITPSPGGASYRQPRRPNDENQREPKSSRPAVPLALRLATRPSGQLLSIHQEAHPNEVWISSETVTLAASMPAVATRSVPTLRQTQVWQQGKLSLVYPNSNSTAKTFERGFAIRGILKLIAHTSFTPSATIAYHLTTKTRPICGRQGYPAHYPGMIQHTDETNRLDRPGPAGGCMLFGVRCPTPDSRIRWG